MKKYICLLLLTLLYACSDNEVDSIFDKSPEQRVEDVKSNYQEILTSAPFGWKTYFSSSNSVGRWLILMNFDENGKVYFKCDPVDFVIKDGFAVNDPVTYRIDFSMNPEIVFESYSQFSAWNDFPVDKDQDGNLDSYAGPETQLIIDSYHDNKLYLRSKSDIAVGKFEEEMSSFVFEQAEESDWDLTGITEVKQIINFDQSKGRYMRFKLAEKWLDPAVYIDAETRMATFFATDGDKNLSENIPFVVTKAGFKLTKPYDLKGFGEVTGFDVDVQNGVIAATENNSLLLEYNSDPVSFSRTHFSVFNNLYLGIEVYHSTGEPIGRDLKSLIDAIRPPYHPEEQRLNVIYFVKDIKMDMGGKELLYDSELTLIFADSDPTYSGHDLYGKNPTLVHIPIEYTMDENRLLSMSLVGTIESAFVAAYPEDEAFAKAKATETMPLIYELLNERGWGLYTQAQNTNNPTVLFKNEANPDGSFFTAYPYTKEDVNRRNKN